MGKQKTYILLTFDYELPLGGLAVSYHESLFGPTDKLLAMASQLDVPLNFFADILSALRFKEWDYDGYYSPYKAQLQKMVKNGHDVQLHLHPHWLNTNLENGLFSPSEMFCLGNLIENEYANSIEDVVKLGIGELEEMLTEVVPEYKCIAYRGGGYNLSPRTEEIIGALKKNGIKIDSSISKGYYFKSDISKVDYRKMPSRANWYIDGGRLNVNNNTGLFEIPIASKQNKCFEMPTFFKMKQYRNRKPAIANPQIHSGGINLADKIRSYFASKMLSFDNYTFSGSEIIGILDEYLEKHNEESKVMLCTVAHPKSMGDYSFYLMKHFVDNVRINYKDSVEFITYKEALDLMSV